MNDSGSDPSVDGYSSVGAHRRGATAALSWVGGVAAGAIVVIVTLSAFGAIGDAGAESSPSPAASPMQGPALVEVVMFHIPPDIQKQCEAKDLHHVGSFAYASVVCHPGSPVDEVQYSSFHDAAALRSEFANEGATAGVREGESTDCSKIAHGVATWWAQPSSENLQHQVGGTPSPGSTRGRLLCFISEDGRAVIEWFDNDTHIYAWASSSADAYVDLFQWWASQAGPSHPRMSGSEMSGSTGTEMPGTTGPAASPSPSDAGM